MGRYQVEREDGCVYVIRDTATGELVQHQVLVWMPERYRTPLRAQRRLKELEEANCRRIFPWIG